MTRMFLLAHHEWSLPVLWVLVGGGFAVGIAWVKSKLMGELHAGGVKHDKHTHKHEHADGVEHNHPHKHKHDHNH